MQIPVPGLTATIALVTANVMLDVGKFEFFFYNNSQYIYMYIFNFFFSSFFCFHIYYLYWQFFQFYLQFQLFMEMQTHYQWALVLMLVVGFTVGEILVAKTWHPRYHTRFFRAISIFHLIVKKPLLFIALF